MPQRWSKNRGGSLTWVKIDKWYKLRDDFTVTECGEVVTDAILRDSGRVGIPLGEDTCESCLRVDERHEEKQS